MISNKQDLKVILDVYNELERNIVNRDHVNAAYELLPTKMDLSNDKTRIMAIKRFVMLNYQDIQDYLNTPDEIKKPGRPKKSQDV